MSLTPSRRLVKRDVSYEFMNRQMVWHAFTVSNISLSGLFVLDTKERVGVPPFLTPTTWHSGYPSTDGETNVSLESLFEHTSYGALHSRYF